MPYSEYLGHIFHMLLEQEDVEMARARAETEAKARQMRRTHG